MLATITEFNTSLTLIENSGIQFLDFALTPECDEEWPGKFVRQTANGPLLLLDYHPLSGKYRLPALPGSAPEVVKPEFSFSLAQSLALLNDVWLPLPFFRFNPPRTFIGGPDNWARMRIVALDKPDAAGNSHRICLAFDTRTYETDENTLALTKNDVKNGVSFTLAYRSDELGDFLDHPWLDSWLREAFVDAASEREQRPQAVINSALREFEYQAHYLNILTMLGQQLQLPELTISAATQQQPAIDVDLILDVGNSHTCGIMVEDHTDDRHGLKHTYELQLRNLTSPHLLYNELFDSRVEFSVTQFGKQNFSLASGREDAFIWPSITRTGREATELAMQRTGGDGASGLSSPRRYLWDKESYSAGWYFSQPANSLHEDPQAIALPLSRLMNDEGQPLYAVPAAERLPVFSAHYSRSSLMTLMLTELLAQALLQINSPQQRQKMLHSQAPRQLRNIILTLPSAMPTPEREIFRRRMQQAIALVWKAMEWHPLDDDFSAENSSMPVPQVQMEWDEATCGQMVWLYNETQVNFGGQAEAFFTSMARPDREPAPGETAGKTLRVASVDIGGGTTDLAITHYQLDNGISSNVKIVPRLLFREGFKLAGDDILLDIIQMYLLPALEDALRRQGLAAPERLMTRLFGHQGRIDGYSILRQQATLQLFIPLGQAILSAYEHFDPLHLNAEVEGTFGELLAQAPVAGLLDYLNREIRREIPGNTDFDILAVPLLVSLSQLHSEFLSSRMKITHSLRALAEVVSVYDCDILLLTGRPSRFPGIQALFRHLQPLPVSRIFSLDGYHTNDWYPFNKQGKIDNPKSTAAVGAMLCLLSLDLRLDNFWFQAGDFQPYSTIRYLGILDSSGSLTEDNVWYRDIDLDRNDFVLQQDSQFQVRGALTLGFRQLDNARWPASPLYSLTITDPALMRLISGERVLHIKLAALRLPGQSAAEGFTLASASLDDGTPIPPEQLCLTLNTLSSGGSGKAYYWIDSGSVYSK